MKIPKLRAALALLLAPAIAAGSLAAPNRAEAAPRSHRIVVDSVAGMVSNSSARRLATKEGLQILNVMWEDTGRYLGSSVGPNISDVTIEVEIENKDSRKETRLMPVIRYPNFTDKTGDIDIDKFFVRVGNEKEGRAARSVSLRELLGDPLSFMSLPNKGTIKGNSLLAKRDEKVLVSAQSAFLPIREGGKTRFWPVIFNYQSYDKNPAVLTILVTRQGTSMSIVDNSRDTVGGGGGWGQRLYFNKDGQRAPLTAERLKDVKSSGVTMNGESADSLGKDANLLMMIQVPLKQKAQNRGMIGALGGAGGYGIADSFSGMTESSPSDDGAKNKESSDLDVAVLGHGPTMGPFTELADLTIERDERFPVRVTVQFYQATSNGVVSAADMTRMAKQIKKVYAQADYVGSLVVPEGEPRPTMWDGVTTAPNLDWRDFAGLRERYTKHGWAGIVYRSDMAAGVYDAVPHPGAVLVTEGCNHIMAMIIK